MKPLDERIKYGNHDSSLTKKIHEVYLFVKKFLKTEQTDSSPEHLI